MRKTLLILIAILSFSGLSYSQTGDIQIKKDARINALVAKQSEVVPPDTKTKIKGYRVQLYFDSDRGTINNARSRFIAQYPRVDTYVEYNAPNYYLKVGDFRTRLEAEKIKAAMTAEFPTSFVIEEDINLPRLVKEEND
ncbi:SPOR domain-containing protein [Crocinitomicaceae bacterium]|nr:SPOR domain-containing protein [Crocinitomicaceae bacterium]|mmetsp:Transcript_10047/g.11678  ORF Transcript_10047/g.11678 Transcript_10047/m.11678 type:complete len:139 (-) Transcript_10047:786-1202(-)